MKSFASELSKIIDVELATLIGSYSYAVYGGHTVAVEGARDIAEYSRELIGVRIGKLSTLWIKGNGLTIVHYGNNYIVVRGYISVVEVM